MKFSVTIATITILSSSPIRAAYLRQAKADQCQAEGQACTIKKNSSMQCCEGLDCGFNIDTGYLSCVKAPEVESFEYRGRKLLLAMATETTESEEALARRRDMFGWDTETVGAEATNERVEGELHRGRDMFGWDTETAEDPIQVQERAVHTPEMSKNDDRLLVEECSALYGSCHSDADCCGGLECIGNTCELPIMLSGRYHSSGIHLDGVMVLVYYIMVISCHIGSTSTQGGVDRANHMVPPVESR